MADFRKARTIKGSRGEVIEVRHDGEVIWRRNTFRYVSLGDSIAAGHTIDDNWEANYGTRSQYGEYGNTSTVIVPGSYTDLIHTEIRNRHRDKRVYATSFAHSGDTVSDLVNKLDHAVVRNEIAKANLVTVYIGANDILGSAIPEIGEYIAAGESALNNIAATVTNNLNVLNTDSAATSYISLFNKLNSINSEATYVFMNVYNPYKYLWLDDGRNGFFAPVLNTIPNMDMFGLDVDGWIKDNLLANEYIRILFDRINRLSSWSENYILKLNQILKTKITSYQASHPNFLYVNNKAVFDSVPDRPISSLYHYNDLVNVEYTRGYDTMQMDWGRLYHGDPASYWTGLATKYVNLSGIDMGGLTNELLFGEGSIDNPGPGGVVADVIIPDIDPHPEAYGHYVLKRAIADVLNWQSLTRYHITYNANGGSGSMNTQEVVTVGSMTVCANLNSLAFGVPGTGYYFTGWNTKADGSGTSYSNGQTITITGDMTLYAQWSNMYTVTFRHSYDAFPFTSSDTGPMEYYALWIAGYEQADLGAFSNGPRTYQLPYGTALGVVARVKSGSGRSYVTMNGTTVAGKSSDARYSFNLTGNVDINFEWNWFLDGWQQQNYWNCYITMQ